MQKAYRKLESQRKQTIGLSLVGLALELAGAILIFTHHRLPGMILAMVGLILFAAVIVVGRRRYEDACAQARAEYSLGLERIQTISRKETAALPLPAARFAPASQAADRPLYLHTMRGEVKRMPLLLTEVTLPYHLPGENARQFLIGTLASFEAPKCARKLLVFTGHPLGGSVREADYPGYQLLDTQGHAYRALSADGEPLSQAQSAAMDVFCAGEEKDAVILADDGRVSVLFSSRFYSGSGALNTPLPADALKTSPLPGWDKVPALVRTLCK